MPNRWIGRKETEQKFRVAGDAYYHPKPIKKIVIKDPEYSVHGRTGSGVWWAMIYYEDKTKEERPLIDEGFEELLVYLGLKEGQNERN